MNPLVSEMLETRSGQDVELRFLEDLLNDDCKCESTHHAGSLNCTFIAVARKRGCTLNFNICQASYDWNLRVIAANTTVCDTCREKVADCWEIRPI